MAIDKRLQIYDENGNLVDYDILASDVKFLPDGKDLPTKLDEMQDAIDAAGSGDGTVTGVKIGSTTYEPTDGVVDLSSPMSNKVDKETGKGLSTNDYTTADKTKLGSLPTNPVQTISVNGGTPSSPVNGNVDISVEGGETQVVSVDDVAILDGFTHNTILAAASARSVMLLKDNVDTLYSKLNDLFDKLAGIAFTDTKPTSSWKPAWSAAAFPTHTITVGTLTDVTVYYDGTAKAAGSTITADEGEVTLKLTPASNTMLLTSGISIKKSGNIDVDFTTASGTGANAGSTLVTFVLGADVTFSAAASSGIAVQLAGTNSGNVTQSVNGVPLSGDNRAIVLSHAEHYSWDGNPITLSVNGVNLTATTDYTITDNQDGTKTVTILKEFTSDTYPIVINIGAVEDDHAVLDLDNVGDHVSIKRSGSTLADGAHVYQGETINIVPDSGFTVSSASATSGGNAVALSGDSTGYSYTLGAGDVSSSGVTIAISASATALIPIAIGTLIHCSTPSGVTNPTGVAGSGTVNIQLQADSGYAIQSAGITISGATVGIITNSGQVFTIPITHDGTSQSISIAVSASASVSGTTVNVKKITGVATVDNSGTMSDSDATMTVADDNTIQCSVSANGQINIPSGYGLFSAELLMGSTDISNCIDFSTLTISIPSITDTLTLNLVVRTAVDGMFLGEPNYGVSYFAASSANVYTNRGNLIAGGVPVNSSYPNDAWCAMSEFVKIPGGTNKLKLEYGNILASKTDSNLIHQKRGVIIVYNAYGRDTSHYTIVNAGDSRTVDWPPTAADGAPVYIRMSFIENKLNVSKISSSTDSGSTWTELFDGSEKDITSSNNE